MRPTPGTVKAAITLALLSLVVVLVPRAPDRAGRVAHLRGADGAVDQPGAELSRCGLPPSDGLHGGPGHWLDLQFARFVRGAWFGAGPTWDSRSADWRDHWASAGELEAWGRRLP